MLDLDYISEVVKTKSVASPFNHVEIDRFLPTELAEKVNAEFPDYGSDIWYSYKNQIEDKKALNDWNRFPEATYRLFSYLTSDEFVAVLSRLFGVNLFPDPGLHGGGWHLHGNGGKLNPHLDYNIHPKLKLQRKLNLIIYLCENWKDSWGGHFGLWEQDRKTGRPGKLAKEISVGFNKAVIFDTTQDSWHGLSQEVHAPESSFRKSLAVYYLCIPPQGADSRGRALFAPTEAQVGDPLIEELIQKRAQVSLSHQVYRNEKAI
jgi:Rps23 Pro-64 3,4-dihydroxylase Tpa1-like proline 4-hydroxylase